MEGYSYDEDLAENRFFTIMQTKYRQLHQQAARQRLLICIPRTGVFARFSLTQADFESHILQPNDGKSGCYTTLNNKEVQLSGDSITTTKGFKEIRIVHILFEETYYNDQDDSYRVVCIDRLLEGGNEVVEDPVSTCLETLDDCADFLWGSKYSKYSQKQVDDLVTNFRNTSQQMETLRHTIDETSALFSMAMQIALRDSVLRKTVRQHHGHMDNLKTSMETYILHGVYGKVFKAISSFLASQDAALNKTTRNLSELQVRDVGVRPEFTANVPRARRELSTLNQYRTPLEKLHCLRRTVMAISQPGFRARSKEPAPAMSSDDLLPLLVYLVVKADIPNWLANLTFMMNFRFSSFADGEFGFYLASIEAAVEHVKMGNMSNVVIGAANPEKLHVLRRMMSTDSMWQNIDQADTDTSAIDVLFQHAREGHTTDVAKMLELSSNDHSWLLDQMCHPLCGCDKCEELVATKRNDPRAVTASSRDDRGGTAMHVAAMYGHTDVINVLLLRGGDVNATDYHGSTPLHVACSRGQQHVVLLLLDEGASVNVEDNDGNTPLHLCCANGHEDCVKAMTYSNHAVDVNAANCQGDTPLHLTTRWGYESLVQILLEHGASVEARNRRKETPIMCSYNVNVSRSLQEAANHNSDGKDNYIQSSSPPIASSFSPPDNTDSFTTSFAKTASRARQRSRRSSSPYSKMVEKLLRSVADGDLLMVKYQLGWLSDTDESDDDEEVSLDAKLCHPLCQCSKCATLQKRTLVSSSGLSVNSCNAEGFSPVHVAAVHGHDSMVALFLRRGSNINSRGGGSQQCTPLHLACQYNHPLIVIQLLQHGAKCNVKDARGNTPLHYCCLNGHVKPAKFLIKHGANVNQTNHRGNTPLHEAARWNFGQAVRLLIEEGHANPFTRNKAQLMPIQLTQNDEVVKILRNAALNADQGLDEVSSPDPGSEVTDTPPTSPYLSPSQDAQQANNASQGASGNLGSLPRHVSPKDLFLSSASMEMQQLQALNQSVRAFDKARRLRRSITQDKSEPLPAWMKHQYHIQHFDHNKLRHVSTVDKSQPRRIIRAPSLDEAEPPRQGVEGWIAGNTGVSEESPDVGGDRGSIDGIAEGTQATSADGVSISDQGEETTSDNGLKQTALGPLNPDVLNEPNQFVALTTENVRSSHEDSEITEGSRAAIDEPSPLQEHAVPEDRPRANAAKKYKSIISFAESETEPDPGEPRSHLGTQEMKDRDINNEQVLSVRDKTRTAELSDDTEAESEPVVSEDDVKTSGPDGPTPSSEDATGSSTQAPSSPTEMQDVMAHAHITPPSPGHRRVGSNISLDQMTSLTLSMNAYAEAAPSSEPTCGSGDLEKTGFAEVLRGDLDQDLTDAKRLEQQQEALLSTPLTDSEIDCMEPLNQDGHIS
ncbi:ankyrin repeat domain-containing protein 27-like [Patiria miniata]|uniref:VPS9 domain-containing protein n=1 Tax=Patiria miniata TaxID=46514 RepID=A0A914AXA4_PATMI|nr:ankyrin repeat domain-containing protein 27-like [Patiria miniata]